MKTNTYLMFTILAIFGIITFFKRKKVAEVLDYSANVVTDASERAAEVVAEKTEEIKDKVWESEKVVSPNSPPVKPSKYPNPNSNVRGMRNNNPGNVEDNQSWINKIPSVLNTDGRFSQFYEMEYGIRAAAILIKNYMNGKNSSGQELNTIRKILNRWAPPIGNFKGESYEQDTSAYVRHVATLTGFEIDEVLSINVATFKKLLKAIFIHENGGAHPTDAQIAKGIELAGIV